MSKKEVFVPKKEAVTRIVEKIRAELLEDGPISEETIALVSLLDKSAQLKEYFSKFEQKELKVKLEEIKLSEPGILASEMIKHIEAIAVLVVMPSMFPM